MLILARGLIWISGLVRTKRYLGDVNITELTGPAFLERTDRLDIQASLDIKDKYKTTKYNQLVAQCGRAMFVPLSLSVGGAMSKVFRGWISEVSSAISGADEFNPSAIAIMYDLYRVISSALQRANSRVLLSGVSSLPFSYSSCSTNQYEGLLLRCRQASAASVAGAPEIVDSA